MSNSRQRLKKMLAEGAVIVLSILLAFWIDAWWSGQQDLARETTMLESLLFESTDNRSELDKTLRLHSGNKAGTDAFFRSTPSELLALDSDSSRALIHNLVIMWTFDPQISGAELLLSTSQSLSENGRSSRQLTSNWLGLIKDAEEEKVAYYRYALSAAEILAEVSTESVVEGADFVTEMAPRLGPKLLSELRSNDEFVAAVSMKLFQEMVYNLELNNISSALDDLLTALASSNDS